MEANHSPSNTSTQKNVTDKLTTPHTSQETLSQGPSTEELASRLGPKSREASFSQEKDASSIYQEDDLPLPEESDIDPIQILNDDTEDLLTMDYTSQSYLQTDDEDMLHNIHQDETKEDDSESDWEYEPLSIEEDTGDLLTTEFHQESHHDAIEDDHVIEDEELEWENPSTQGQRAMFWFQLKDKTWVRYWPFIALIILLMLAVLRFFGGNLFSALKPGEDFSIAYNLNDKRGPKISHFVQERQLESDPDAQILVNALKEKHLSVGVSNRDAKPLLAAIDEEQPAQANPHGNLPEPEVIPWFYYSPNVSKTSPYSMANTYPLVDEEVINDFSWNLQGQDKLLLHEGKPYTGWYSLTNEGWRFYEEGQPTDHAYNLIESQALMAQVERIQDLVPGFTTRKIYERPINDYAFHIGLRPYSYSILYKNPQGIILTSPPGTKGSSLLSTTENFVDIPMEVVQEARTPSGSWLHVYIGYDELGWIKKDVTKTDYVTTYYSERNLLDNIEYTLQEEFANIQARIGGSFVNNDTMAQISVDNQQFFPASTQKIYVLGELYHQYAMGNLSPDTYVTMNDYDKVPGAGTIQGLAAGSQFSLNELVDQVALISDNTAANLLIDAVGGGEVINPHLHKMGLYDTYVSGKYYHEGTWFRTTPENAARFFALLANNKLNGAPYDEQLINKLMLNTHTFLRSYLWSVPGWNKTGLGGTEQNDVATFNTELGSYSLAVYTAEPAYYKQIEEQLGALGYRVYQVYMEIRSQLYQSVEDPAELTGDPEYGEVAY